MAAFHQTHIIRRDERNLTFKQPHRQEVQGTHRTCLLERAKMLHLGRIPSIRSY